MDTITHGIVGALVGKALFAGQDTPSVAVSADRLRAHSSATARVTIAACTIGSIFPDSDIFAGTIARNPLAIMEWHRNITHSLVMLPLWAVLLAGASIPIARWLRCERPAFIALTGIYAVGLATHVFLDVVTSFGTVIWSPLQYSRAAWDWLFIIDLTLTALALLPQLAAWCYREPDKFAIRAGCTWGGLTLAAFGGYTLARMAGDPFPIWVAGIVSFIVAGILFVPRIGEMGFKWRRASWCRAGLALVCLYLECTAFAHTKAVVEVNRIAAENHLQVENLAALPLPPSLTHWAGVITTPEGVWRTTFHVPGGTLERSQLYASTRSGPWIEQARKLHDVQVYLWFARFPIWRVLQRDDHTVVEISDVRFFRDDEAEVTGEAVHSKALGGIRSSPAGFTFQIIFDAVGNVISDGFKKPE